MVSVGFTIPAGHDFLPKISSIDPRLASLRNFVVSVDVSRTKLDTLSYDVRDNRLHIYLTPKQGFFETKDVVTSAGNFSHDLIVTIEVPTLESLGSVYHDNAEFFYQVPIVNIDHHADNGRYGHVNFIDVVASSISETTYELVKKLGQEKIDEQIATTLLTGIIAKTRGFQNNRVTPKSLAVASALMTAGAKREDIVQHLYQTKSVATLKLWGRALGRLQNTDNGRIVWTSVTASDLSETGATAQEAFGLLDELMTEAATAEHRALFIETPTGIVTHLIVHGEDTPSGLSMTFHQEAPHHWTATAMGQLSVVSNTIVQALVKLK